MGLRGSDGADPSRAGAAADARGAAGCLAGGGEAGALMRSIDWASTPLGPVEGWSPALSSTVALLLQNQSGMLLWWGPRYVQLYNDAYRPVLGDKHPRAMGQVPSECWPEIWHIIGPMVDRPFHGGPASTSDDLFLFINRKGFAEETHFRVAYSPVPDPSVEPTRIGGVLATVVETTEQVYAERQLRTLRELGAGATTADTAERACATAAATLALDPWDVPFALFYLLDGDGANAHLSASVGVDGPAPALPADVDLSSPAEDRRARLWPLRDAARDRRLLVVHDLTALEGILPTSANGARPRWAIVLPLASPDHPHAYGVLVAGVSPHRTLDEGYQTFFELVASQVVTAIRNARAFEAERRRAQELEALDRAKTDFFSNVSHELRTPLTLIMGPTDDALASPERALKGEALELVQRNELRLLKLVNTLLDFARMEAGRAEASFQRTDLGRFTREVASAFSMAMERAGLEFVLDCRPLDGPTYVDRALWEKVVLNLLSNALKFTFAGRITVSVRSRGAQAELEVSDTGAGIPAAELPRLFERFRRVPGVRARTHEGSGIGLALVSEIVKIHGGTVEVRSVLGQGTTFTVRLPLGKAHLDPTRIDGKPSRASTALGAAPFVAEALRWLPGTGTDTATDAGARGSGVVVPAEVANARVIVADDNADMREYVASLLSEHWRVETAPDGAAALAAARRERPDLILTDVMMPGLDGFALLREVRADPALAATPVVMLSARAGEESSVEGFQAGADDYLVKPFSSRELVARVSTHLQLHRSREHLELALKGAALGAWDWNVETGEFVHNARWAELRGYAPGELPARIESLFGGVHPDDLPRLQQALQDHFEGRRPEYSGELRVATKNGGWIWIVQRGKVMARDARGRPLRMAGTSLDITGRKRAELEQRFLAEVTPSLHKSLEYEDTLSALAEVVSKHLADYCVIDLVEDGEIRRARVSSSLEAKRELAEQFARLPLGGQRTPILLQVLTGGGRLVFGTVASSDLEEWARNEEHLRLLRETEVRSLLWVPLVGRDRILGGFCLASATPGRHYSLEDVPFVEELARRASLSLEHAHLYRAAERAIVARDEMLAVVAHDLRNPLGSIVMQASILKARPGERDARARKASERIERAAERMRRLIQDLLDVTRVEAGQLALDREALRAADVVLEAVEGQKGLAASSSIELVVDDAPGAWPGAAGEVFADRHRILQVFENLIGNAVKFTGPGGRVAVAAVPRGDAVLCYVRDTGRGIPADELPHLFDRFWQARRSREEKRSGAGLGLAIVKGIVEAHGGRIWVESAPGEGSTFYFTIPARAARAMDQATVS